MQYNCPAFAFADVTRRQAHEAVSGGLKREKRCPCLSSLALRLGEGDGPRLPAQPHRYRAGGRLSRVDSFSDPCLCRRATGHLICQILTM